jgi:2-phospho-L-lactate guanylyltransferase (CobY/MobA/RfbA family)
MSNKIKNIDFNNLPFYRSYFETYEFIKSDADKKEYIEWIFHYFFLGEDIVVNSDLVKGIIISIKPNLKSSISKAKIKIETAKKNAEKRKNK